MTSARAALEVTAAPRVLGWLGLLLGWVLTYLVGRYAVRRLGTFTTPRQPLPPQMRSLGLSAWLLGAGLVILLSLGLPTAGGVGGGVVVFEALGVLISGIFLIFVRFFLRGLEPSQLEPAPLATPWAGILALLVVAAARQLALAAGISF